MSENDKKMEQVKRDIKKRLKSLESEFASVFSSCEKKQAYLSKL